MRKTSELIWQDAQHQVLFEILDAIAEPGAGESVLRRLRDYTETHFTLEERYMELLDYPGTEAHRRAHDRFREEIDDAIASTDPHDELFRTILSTFLTEWLKRHVFGIDKKLEDYIFASDAR